MLYLRCIEQAALLAVIVVFARRRLFGYYPAFTMFFAAKGARSLCLLSLDPNDLLYGKCWALSAPFLMVLQLLVVLELTGKIVEHYPQIGKRGGQLLITSCFGAGAVIGAISYVFQFGHERYPWYVPAAIGAYKVFDWITVGALVFLSVWLTVFPEPIKKNVQWHRWLLFAYIGVAPGTALMFSTVTNQHGRIRYTVDCLLEVAEITCCILWMIVMKLAGEAFPYVPKRLSDEELKRIDGHHRELFSALRENYPLPEIIGES